MSDLCYYSPWSGWSKCRITNTKTQSCGGEGLQKRVRTVIQNINNPLCKQKYRLVENRVCFSTCNKDKYYKNKNEIDKTNNIQLITSTTALPPKLNNEILPMDVNGTSYLSSNWLFVTTKTTKNLKSLSATLTSITTTICPKLLSNVKYSKTIPSPSHHRHREHYFHHKKGVI